MRTTWRTWCARGLAAALLFLASACGGGDPDDGSEGPGAVRSRYPVVPRVPRAPPAGLAGALGQRDSTTIDWPPGLVLRCPAGWETGPTTLGSFALGPPRDLRSIGAV